MNNIHIGYSNDVIIDIANGEYSLYLRKSRADLEAEERGEGETLARHEKMLIRFMIQIMSSMKNTLNLVYLCPEENIRL